MDVKEFFDENADQYSPSETGNGLKDGFQSKARFVAEMGAGERLLDIGCGDGSFLTHLLDTTDLAEAVGMDISSGMLSTDRRNRLVVCLGDAQELPFLADKFHITHFDTVLHHIVGDSRSESKENVVNALKEAKRVTDDEGYILVTERHQHSRLIPNSAVNSGIFWGLEVGSKLLALGDDRVKEGQPPISFYSEEEFQKLTKIAGMTATKLHTVEYVDLPVIQKLLVSKVNRTTWVLEPEHY